MNHALTDAIAQRNSANFFDPARGVDDDNIHTLISWATRAPTAFNLQNWRFIAVRSQDGKRRLRMHYVTQTGVNPPTFTFFVNHSDLVNDTYQRYVENRMRSTFDFAGTPIRLFFRKKEQKDA